MFLAPVVSGVSVAGPLRPRRGRIRPSRRHRLDHLAGRTAMLDLAGLLHRGDLDELVRAVDAAASAGSWDDVETLRVGAIDALERTGRQLWGPAAYAAYRLALGAPVELAVPAVLAGHDRHTLGPLTEVLAQHHTWDDVADALPGGPINGVVATERVARGEDLTADDRAEVFHLDVPACWQPFEGTAPLAEYRADEVVAPAPTRKEPGPWIEVAAAPAPESDRARVSAAFLAIAQPWAVTSSGSVDVIVVDDHAGGAVAALVAGEARMRTIGVADAMAWMTWSGASGGARGRRRGVAAGRSAAWWAVRSVVGDRMDDWDDPDELEFQLEDCAFHEFTDGGDQGWRLQLAMTHPDGWTVAVAAQDHGDDEDDEDHDEERDDGDS